jgi:hypothetical protein
MMNDELLIINLREPSEGWQLVCLFCGKNGNYFSYKINRIRNPDPHQTMVS